MLKYFNLPLHCFPFKIHVTLAEEGGFFHMLHNVSKIVYFYKHMISLQISSSHQLYKRCDFMLVHYVKTTSEYKTIEMTLIKLLYFPNPSRNLPFPKKLVSIRIDTNKQQPFQLRSVVLSMLFYEDFIVFSFEISLIQRDFK